MPSYFFDTSALVKRYYDEPGTDVVDAIIEPAENDVLITSLAVIETVSAFRRKQNRDSISRDEVDSLLAAFSTKPSQISRSFPWTNSCSTMRLSSFLRMIFEHSTAFNSRLHVH
ncbi:PIN domain-containing protein [Haladaptatus litoreus]|uniref:PIN domain-containing protein n=1 Tax=Haladaptatus litoreus TaxID=553468 RepID=A0A1N7ET54_9EURY|nr:type II toxin-antitoxin system VapC family toxin [Haladaptatus litoreus]SIR91283.1 PIN domain-containing protein [Haladaptatus litoreus]